MVTDEAVLSIPLANKVDAPVMASKTPPVVAAKVYWAAVEGEEDTTLKTEVDPEHIEEGLAVVEVITGGVLTVTAFVAVPVHPFASVTVSV